MKKSLLTAALIAGFAATAAHAESSVTLYGIVDGGVNYQNFSGSVNGKNIDNDYVGMADGVNSGNRWGLKGTEDLGNGLKAVFQLESGFDLGTGKSGQGSRLFGRQATVGLQSDGWGRLDFGRQANFGYKYLAEVASPFGPAWGQANVGSAFSATGVRLDNMIMYQTPTIAGFQLGVGYSFNADGAQQISSDGSQKNTRSWTTGLRYGNGPLAAVVTYDRYKSPDSETDVNDRGVNVNSWNLAVSYDFKVVKVYAGGGQTRNGWFSSNSSLNGASYLKDNSASIGSYDVNDNLKVNSYALGVSAPVGANGQVLASWMMADIKDSGIHNWGSNKQNVYSVGYSYALSKRTNVYALGSYANNVNFQDDLKATQFAVGLRHRF